MPGRPAADAAEPGLPPARALARSDARYPAALLDLRDAPSHVWIAGAWPDLSRRVAIVGARAATPYGLDLARRLAGDLARLGLVVVSGLARGIDSAAHEGALETGGASVAVLPFPLDGVPPGTARRLAARIAERGALLSERAPGAAVFRGVFLQRNRLIAALSEAVVVVEAAERSGSLSTAASGRRLGRVLLAVPGDVDRPTSRGTLALLRAGALPCADAADVVAALDRERAGVRPRAGAATPPSAEAGPTPVVDTLPDARVAAALGQRAVTVDEIAASARLDVGATLAALLALEWAGLAARAPGSRWRRLVRGA